ncbi:MAG TPA: M24 family metallopeptidase [Desulfobacterales bacterium]|nr:M24 family metallopeptidase [Desulfobacterales bacterium]
MPHAMQSKDNSAAFPCGAGPKKLEKHEPIMVDFAYEYNGYHMDETRMFSIGPMSDEALWASEAAIKIHDTIIEKARPGLKASELYDISVSLADELGYGHVYLGPPGHKVSFVGHGIGLELIERPFLARGKEDVLQLGMTFAVEPKMVFKDRFGVGVESVFVVTDDGGRLISKVPVKIFTC